MSEKTSEVRLISRGTPQGSVLSPLLFSIYTADFSEYLNNCKLFQFADDSQLRYSFKITNIQEAVAAINNDLRCISEVASAHKLTLNEKKTELLVFGSLRDRVVDSPDFKIVLNNCTILPKNEARNLGLIMDSKLNFKGHVKKLIQNSFAKLKLLYLHKNILTTQIKIRLCDSLILSSIAYADIIYWPALSCRDKYSLQKIQNACIRFAYNLRKFDHITEKYTESK